MTFSVFTQQECDIVAEQFSRTAFVLKLTIGKLFVGLFCLFVFFFCLIYLVLDAGVYNPA